MLYSCSQVREDSDLLWTEASYAKKIDCCGLMSVCRDLSRGMPLDSVLLPWVRGGERSEKWKIKILRRDKP